MKVYNLHSEQFLPISIEEAWDFFSDPRNLAVICPPEMRFDILTDLNGTKMYEGQRISYKLRPVANIPTGWTTKIAKVQEPHLFVDTQEKGPYALWEHTHTFTAKDGGVHMTDDVRYAIPFGIIGTVAHSLFVRKRLQHIFDFRFKKLEELFPVSSSK